LGAELTLTPQTGTVLAILAFAIYLFVFEIVRVDVAAILIMLVLGGAPHWVLMASLEY
jgi:hypothetical protein